MFHKKNQTAGSAIKRIEPQPYGDLADFNTNRVLLDAVGREVLEEVSAEYLDLLDSTCIIYEKNGDYALGVHASSWCRLVNAVTRNHCGTDDTGEALASGKWVCHEASWRVAQCAIESGEPVDLPCAGGLRVYAVPIKMDEEVVGGMVLGYGDPPKDPETLQGLADRLALSVEELRQYAESYQSRPPTIIEAAKQHLKTTAKLLGEVVRRRRNEEALRASEVRLRRQAEQLAEADRRKDEFLAMLAHELRNPLAPIHNAVEILGRRPSADTMQWAIDLISRQAGHLTRLVDDLLDVARITSGRVQLRKETVDLRAIIEQAVETELPSVEQHRHDLTVSCPAQSVLMTGDSVRLIQVIGNLLHNAVKYTPEGGQIRIGLQRHGQQAVVSVRDTGIGISAELLPHVFDLFIQAERSLDRAQGGLGLGLTLVRRLVELHGGQVEALSEGLDKGSEFRVTLPILPMARSLTAVEAATSSYAPRSAGHRILVVDDNADMADSLQVLLNALGHEAYAAYNGASALEAIPTLRPEVVLLDLGLPGMNGYEVAKRIRADHPRGRLLLVALTGYGQDEDRHRTHEAGFDQHLLKPADPEKLQALLSAFKPLP